MRALFSTAYFFITLMIVKHTMNSCCCVLTNKRQSGRDRKVIKPDALSLSQCCKKNDDQKIGKVTLETKLEIGK